MPEAEPGFMAAALAGLEAAGFRLTGRAMRAHEAQAVLYLETANGANRRTASRVSKEVMVEAASEVLLARGEPSPYALLHAAAWCRAAAEGSLALLWEEEEGRLLATLGEILDSALAEREVFSHLKPGADPESGRYWLVDAAGAAPPLADRVEAHVAEVLRREPAVAEHDLEVQLCDAFPGLLTPGRRLVQACLRSYGVEDAAKGTWRLRSEDDPHARARDVAEIKGLLAEVGRRAGLKIREGPPLAWVDPQGATRFAFKVQDSAVLGEVVDLEGQADLTLVIPGGRASLIAEKARRDPRIRAWLDGGLRVVKFRHVRRLAGDTTLRPDNLEERLALDPPGREDPQMPLL
jgi:hypothetical protein